MGIKNILRIIFVTTFLLHISVYTHAGLIKSWKFTKESKRLEGPESPHEDWANPYSLGPLKCLFIVDLRSSRCIVELQQRLEINYNYVYTHRNNLCKRDGIFMMGGGRKLDEVDELRRLLKNFPHEVMVIPNQSVFKILPEDIKELIIQKVKEGMGLVFLNSAKLPRLSSVSKENLPKCITVSFSADLRPLLEIKKLKKGRVVSFNRGYDYKLLPQILLWAGNKESGVMINDIKISPQVSERGNNLGVDITLSKKATDLLPVALSVKLKNKFNDLIEEKKVKLTVKPGSENLVHIDLPKFLSNGKYSLGLILRNGQGKVLDYGIVEFSVNADVVIGDIKLDKKLYKNGEKLSGKIFIQNRKLIEKKATLEINIFDTYKRIIQKKKETVLLKSGQNEISFSFPSLKTFSYILDINVILKDSNGQIDNQIFNAFVTHLRKVDDLKIEVYMMRAYNSTVCNTLQKVGIDTGGVRVNRTEKPLFKLRKNNFDIIGNLTGGVTPGTGKPRKLRDGIPNDWPDPKVGDKENIRSWVGVTSCPQAGKYNWNKNYYSGTRGKISLKYTTFLNDLCDEFTFQHDIYNKKNNKPWDDWCFCHYTIKAFRKYLQKMYGTLALLNSGWETDFKNWSEVIPLTTRKAKFRSNIAPWLDFRIFLSKEVAGALIKGQSALDSLSPGVRGSANIHFEGPFAAFMAYYLFGPDALKAADCYPRTFDQVRSHGIHPKYRRMIVGYSAWGHTREQHDYKAWENLMYGGGRIGIYNAIELLYEGSVVAPTYSPGRQWLWTKYLNDSMKKTGIAKVILSSKPHQTQVAILDSYRSRFAYYLEPQHFDKDGWYVTQHHLMGLYGASIAGWSSYGRICDALGLRWKLVADEELDSLEDFTKYKGIILPRTTCISNRTMSRLKQFVKKGGLLIADYRLAEYNEHGKPQDSSELLKEIFGIKRDKINWEDKVNKFAIKGAGCISMQSMMKSTGREIAVSLTDGESHGKYMDDVPNTIIKKLGKGYAVYLNFSPSGYKHTRSKMAALFNDLFSLVNLQSKTSVEDKKGKIIPNILCLSHRRGQLKYISVLKSSAMPKSDKVYLVLPQKSHVYQLDTHKYFGYTNRIEIAPKANKGLFFAMFPYKVENISITSENSVEQGEEFRYKVSLKTSSRNPGDQVIRIEIYTPSGDVCRYWTKNVVTNKGIYQEILPIALNEKLGDWKIKVLDVVSGQEAKKTFKVEKK